MEIDEYDDELTDGRRLRAARNREAVVTAVLEIIREQQGGPIPGAALVAERSGVSERTVFRHFADLDSLFFAAAERQRPLHVTALAPRPADKEVDKRIAAIVKSRVKLYEEISPVRRVAIHLAAAHESMAEILASTTVAAREQLNEVFDPELRRAGRNRSVVLDEIELATSWSAWEHLRTVQGGSRERARKIVTELLTGVLSPYGPRRGR